jgi:hypothetical protein
LCESIPPIIPAALIMVVVPSSVAEMGRAGNRPEDQTGHTPAPASGQAPIRS